MALTYTVYHKLLMFQERSVVAANAEVATLWSLQLQGYHSWSLGGELMPLSATTTAAAVTTTITTLVPVLTSSCRADVIVLLGVTITTRVSSG